jgi:hypothetical protein
MKNKTLLCILTISIFTFTSQAQQNKKKEKSLYYPVVVQFHSVCCGVPSEKPLTQFIASFKKANKIQKISAAKTHLFFFNFFCVMNNEMKMTLKK